MAIYRGAGGSGDAVNDSSSETRLAVEARDDAIAAKEAAQAAQTAAQLAETNAETAEANAEFSETNAATSASNAASSASSASSSASSASTSATNAANSASSAASSLAAIGSSETNAANSATAAATSASQAATSATNASNSATAASTSASNASASASAASTSASQAATSATAASNSASAANTSATNAASSATSASNSASAASTSATNASSSASAASTSATNAASSASSASTSASTATTQAGIATTKASEASTSATNAATSETNAATSETNAAGSASAAATSASNAATSETNAASSASSASTSASTATTQAGIATTQASNASTSATNAATSETNAAASASAASTSASNASTSASSAASAQSAAETARDQTLAAFDSFDDRYLGQKSTAPTVDNDGDPLVAGALYFNTTTNEMKVYDGTQWLNAYASLSGALLATSNLADLNNVATARTNLGLGTAATTDSTAYATAAQGALADTALQSFTETDPVYTASSWYGTTNNSSNWNTAYGWGNHASAGYVNTAGARSALSFTAGSGGYNSSTGVITIPTNTNQLTNGAGFVTSSGSVNYATNAGNADTTDGLHVHSGRNNGANQIVRTDGNGYIQCGYINSSNGNEGNNSNPARVWGTNGGDDYLRTYLTSALSVNYSNSTGSVPASGISGQNGMWTSAGRPGATRLYRRDSDDPYNVQNHWTGSHWWLRGYYNNDFHAECRVGYSDSSGSSNNGARAWVNFNGSGSISTRASFNIAGITDNATGDYTISFVSGTMPASDYVLSGGVNDLTTATATGNSICGVSFHPGTAPTASAVRIFVKRGSTFDSTIVSVAFFR